MECDVISLVQGSLESNTFARYLVQVMWPRSRTCPNLFPVPWTVVCHNVQLVKLSGLCCIWSKMDNSFSTMSSSNSRKLLSFWGTIMKLPSELCGEDTVNISTICSWVKKSRIVPEIWTWMTNRSLEGLLPQLTVLTGKDLMNLFKNIIELLTSAAIACIGIEVLPYPVYCPDLALSDFLVVCCSQEIHIKGINFTCDEVQAATRKMFWQVVWWVVQQHVQKTYSGLAALCQTGGRLRQ